MKTNEPFQMAEVVKIIQNNWEKDVGVYDESFLRKSVERRMAILKAEKIEYLKLLKENSEESAALLSSLNITYSQFFRNPLTFAVLEQLILPQILSRKIEGSEIRIWCAGCATGQEAYSLAILLEELTAVASRPIRYRIFGTDIVKEALMTAQEGNYDEEAVSNLKLRYLRKYFTRTGEMFSIDDAIKHKIDFSFFDLLEAESLNPPESIFGDFDIVFCCNLLFYYRMDVRKWILKKIKRSLSKKGFLITGEAEAIFIGKDTELKMIDSGSTIFHLNKKEPFY